MDIIFWAITLYISVGLLFWLLPKLFTVMLAVLGLGCIIGLPFGVYYGVKNMYVAINDNITNKPLKGLLYFITSASIIVIIAYLVIVTYYFFAYFSYLGGFTK